MKKLFVFLTIGAAFLTIAAMTPKHIVSSPVVQEEKYIPPPYAKWGVMAMQKTMEKYPNAQITDYLHMERVVGQSTSVEKFKLILIENGREFGLFVDLKFTNDTEELINITFTETTPWCKEIGHFLLKISINEMSFFNHPYWMDCKFSKYVIRSSSVKGVVP